VTGSSSDLAARAGVIASRQRSLADIEAQRAQARLGIGFEALGARNDYYGQVSSIQNAMAQEQMANTISAFQADQFDAIIQAIRNQKTGRTPRTRRGTGTGGGRGPFRPGMAYYDGAPAATPPPFRPGMANYSERYG
jgi:hypothetical protein